MLWQTLPYLAGGAQNALHVWLFLCASPTAAGGLFNAKFPFLLAQTSLVQVHICLLSPKSRTQLQNWITVMESKYPELEVNHKDHWVQLLELRDAAPEMVTDMPVLCTSPSVILLLSRNWCYFSFQSIYDPMTNWPEKWKEIDILPPAFPTTANSSLSMV